MMMKKAHVAKVDVNDVVTIMVMSMMDAIRVNQRTVEVNVVIINKNQ
jgi:hypothetical protein